jgi:hypothetical protein
MQVLTVFKTTEILYVTYQSYHKKETREKE